MGTDDQKHALADYKEAKLLVLVFTTNHCPVAQAYQERLVALAKDYQPKGVQIVAVNVNKIEPDPPGGDEEAGQGKGASTSPTFTTRRRRSAATTAPPSRRTSSSWTRTARSPTSARSTTT